MPSPAGRLACLLLAAAAGACAAGTRVVPIAPPAGTHTSAAPIADYQQAMDAIAAVVQRDLGLPVPRVALYLYPDGRAYEQGLVADRHMDPAQARDIAKFSRGLGGRDRISANESKLARLSWRERVRFLAHEFTHTIEYDLSGGRRGTSEQWLREGYAEWVSFRTVDALGLGSYAEWRARRLRQFQKAFGRRAPPPLDELSTFRQWIAARNKLGQEATYHQGFLATEQLIERRGREAVVDYFRRFASSADRRQNFRAAFGIELEAFAREFAARRVALR
jgi:hypothetical protein